MAYRYEKIDKDTEEIVIDGWEKGIAASPFKGLADIKNANISSMPGQIMSNYQRMQQSPVFTNGSFTASLSNVVISSTNALQRGEWVLINSSSITNLTNGTYYYVLSNTGGNVNLSLTYEGTLINTFGTTGTAGFVPIHMGKPIAYAIDYGLSPTLDSYYILDATGYVWKNPPGAQSGSTGLGTWSLIDHNAAPGFSSTSGLFVYGSFVHVVTDQIYYKDTATAASIGAAWTALATSTTMSITNNHYCLIGRGSGSGTVFITDGSQIDTLAVIPGMTYDAANGSTYTWSLGALKLPFTDTATVLAEITVSGGFQLIIGAMQNLLYVWDELSPLYAPIVLPENNTQQLVSVNNLVFVFPGSKGNVYVTNGSSVTTVMTVPDYIANSTGGNEDPYFSWGGTMYLRGRVWFSVKAPNCGGVWSFVPTVSYYAEQDTGMALRLENQNSYNGYTGLATVMFPASLPTDQQVNGPQYYTGWDDGTNGVSAVPYGVDFSGSIPYLGGIIIETDAIPTGTALNPQSFSQIEYKLATALVSGESVSINYRVDLNAGWATCGSVNQPSGPLSGYFTVNFQDTQWLQLQIILSSTNTTPSFVPLKEVRIR